jgi:hypothetical protein
MCNGLWQCEIELRRKLQVVKIKCYDKAKTVLFDFTAPLREWLPLVRKKFDREDDTDLILYLSGEFQRSLLTTHTIPHTTTKPCD